MPSQCNRLALIVISLLFYSFIFGQSTSKYYHKNPHIVEQGKDVLMSVTLFTNEHIVSGMLFFRSMGQVSYQEIPMNYNNGNWESIIPSGQVIGEGMEYVIILHKRSWGRISVPLEDNPFDKPLSFSINKKIILDNESKDRSGALEQDNNYVDADILILSPEANSVNRPDEVVIAASLFNSDIVDTLNYIVKIDGKDFSNSSILDGGVMTLIPDGLQIGFHTVELLFKTSYGLDVKPIKWSFRVTKGMVNMSESFRYKGSVGASNSNNSASGVSLVEKGYNGKFDGELSWIKGRYSFRKSSRESIFQQPLNRETLTLQVTDYLKLEYGDVYPSLSPFLLDGKRVRGRHVHIDLPWFDFQYVFGQLTRQVDYRNEVDGGYKLLASDTKFNEDGSRSFNMTRTGYTFPQDINAARISFNFFNKFSGGFHYLKAKDNFDDLPKSINENSSFTYTVLDSTLDSLYINNDYINSYSQYSFKDFNNFVSQNGDSILISDNNWGGASPKENLVVGFNLETALDNRNIIFQLDKCTSQYKLRALCQIVQRQYKR